MLPSDESIKLSLEEGLTQSEIMERCNCPRKHMFRYILNLKRQGSFSWPLMVGGAIHKLLEEHYTLLQKGKGGLTEPKAIEFEFDQDVILDPKQHEEYKYWQLVVGMLVYRHNRYYDDSNIDVHHVEVPIDLVYRGQRLRGIIDLVGSSPGRDFWIMDHKSSSDISDIRLEGWQFRFQFLFYAWLWRGLSGEIPSGTYVNILKKPLERRSVKKGESVEDFCRRIDFNIQAEPHLYFRREWVPIDSGMIDRFQRYTLDPAITEFQMLREVVDLHEDDMYSRFTQLEKEAMLLRANTDHCIYFNTKCEFLELCKENFQDFHVEYIKREHKHPELARFS